MHNLWSARFEVSIAGPGEAGGRPVGSGNRWFLRVAIEDSAVLDEPAAIRSLLVVDLGEVLDLSQDSSWRVDLPYSGDPSNLTVAASLTGSPLGSPSLGDYLTTESIRVPQSGSLRRVALHRVD